MEITSSTRGLTILIATYNASAIIGETLRRLKEMEKVPNLDWEVLIVDNNSTDQTVEIARNCWEYAAELRIINEPKQGAGFATVRGIVEAKYDYIGFVDQDNWVYPDWMVKSVNYLDIAPRTAIIFARGIPSFETEPPIWFDRYQQSFAVGRQSPENGANLDTGRFFYNAGSILRKQAFIELINLGFTPLMRSRAGKQLLAGDDTELQILLRLRGWDLNYQNDL